MKIKKNPKANLENYSGVFTLLGLVLTLFISYIVIEHKSYAATKPTVKFKPSNYEEETTITINLPTPKQEVPEIEQPIPEPEPEPVKQEPIAELDPNHVKKVDDNTIVPENAIESTDNNSESKIDESSIVYETDEGEYVPETITLSLVQTAPVFPGCEKYSKDLLKSKKCFSKKITKFFNRNFDTDVANELELHGIQSIKSYFIIDSNGEIKPDIRTSRTHPKIAEEIKKVLKDLPKMQPATQNGKKVNLMYSLPVRFMIE